MLEFIVGSSLTACSREATSLRRGADRLRHEKSRLLHL
jgi:hypothetical protein